MVGPGRDAGVGAGMLGSVEARMVGAVGAGMVWAILKGLFLHTDRCFMKSCLRVSIDWQWMQW